MTTALGVSLHLGDSIEPPDACLKHVLKGLCLEMCGGIQQKETLEGETGASVITRTGAGIGAWDHLEDGSPRFVPVSFFFLGGCLRPSVSESSA